MNTVTLKEFKKFRPCWLEDKKRSRKLEEIGNRKEKWTAMDVLELEEVEAEDRLWAVLREEFVPAPILHEFACKCAEGALKKAKVTDERSWNAIKVKRLWIKGEAADNELIAAWNAAHDVIRDAAVRNRNTSMGAAWGAAWSTVRDAVRIAAWNILQDEQIDILKNLLKEEEA